MTPRNQSQCTGSDRDACMAEKATHPDSDGAPASSTFWRGDDCGRVQTVCPSPQTRRLTLDVTSRVARIGPGRASYMEGESWGIIDAVMGPAQT